MNKMKPGSAAAIAARSHRARGRSLGQEARRLLSGLDADGAYAFADPSDPESLILRSGGSGISIGAGRFGKASGTALLDAGLAEHSGENRQILVIAGAGRARLQRMRWPRETACLGQHLDLVEEPATPDGIRALRDHSESPLAWMARRRGRDGQPLIDQAAFAAGERLRCDLTLAAMLPRMGADWARPRVDGGGGDAAAGSDAQLAAKVRVDHALAAVGADLSGLLIDLCGFLKGMERIESERNWPPRSGKLVARIALARLAEHYGIDRVAVGPARSRHRSWRT